MNIYRSFSFLTVALHMKIHQTNAAMMTIVKIQQPFFVILASVSPRL